MGSPNGLGARFFCSSICRTRRSVSYTHLYAVFLFHGTYDVPLKASDKESLWESEEVYDFLVCTISPLEGEYEPGEPEWGFLFPAFSDQMCIRDRSAAVRRQPWTRSEARARKYCVVFVYIG